MNKRIPGIQIEEPCHENWDGMSVTERGRFCLSCTKEVVDVTGWRQEEIVDTYVENDGQLCVRIPSEQLQAQRNVSALQPRKWLKGILMALALFIVKSPVVKALSNVKDKGIDPVTDDKENKTIAISGLVVDSAEHHNPLEYATVLLFKNDQLLATSFTGADGRFTFEVEKEANDSGSYEIECSHISFQTVNERVDLVDSLTMDIYMKESTIGLRVVKISGTSNKTITLGGIGMMGLMSIRNYDPPLLDQYDTKTYREGALFRYNLR